MDWQMRPRRAADLEINDVVDGYVVYQSDRDRLHYLNHTAIVLLEACDGKVSAAELPGLLAAIYRLEDPPRQEVEQCLNTLLHEGLLLRP
jgi:hypothetical protein